MGTGTQGDLSFPAFREVNQLQQGLILYPNYKNDKYARKMTTGAKKLPIEKEL